jgi:hypothetical protein
VEIAYAKESCHSCSIFDHQVYAEVLTDEANFKQKKEVLENYIKDIHTSRNFFSPKIK